MDTLPIINRTYESYKAVIDICEHVKKPIRYSLGRSLEEGILSLLQDLILAKNAPKPHKGSYLIRAESHLEISVLKLRLFLELHLANETKIFQTQSKLLEIGRMLGGWKKSLATLPSPRDGTHHSN